MSHSNFLAGTGWNHNIEERKGKEHNGFQSVSINIGTKKVHNERVWRIVCLSLVRLFVCVCRERERKTTLMAWIKIKDISETATQ